jgi:hypothetical protein
MMAVSTTPVAEQIQAQREQELRAEVMRLKQLVRDYDKELDAALDVWGTMAEVLGYWNRYDRLNERAKELGAIK